MRALVLLLAALAVSACAGAGPQVFEARMPLKILRDEGQPPRMGEAALQAGGSNESDPFSFSIWFNSDGEALGDPRSAGWSVKFGEYCRDRPSWVESVLIAPSGQIRPGFRVSVPAGPDRGQDWSSGYVDDTEPGMLEALDIGGRFTLALRDDEGQLWHAVVIDTFSPARRERLFAANRAAFRATDPATVPVASDMLMVVRQEPVPLPSPPRPCPAG